MRTALRTSLPCAASVLGSDELADARLTCEPVFGANHNARPVSPAENTRLATAQHASWWLERRIVVIRSPHYRGAEQREAQRSQHSPSSTLVAPNLHGISLREAASEATYL